MWNIWFFCFEIWLVVFCLLRMSNGCPLISQLWWRGQKRREFSNWFPTFRTLNKLVYSVHTVWHLRQQRKTTFSSSNYKTNKKQQKHDNVFSSTYQQEIWHVFPSQYLLVFIWHNISWYSSFKDIQLPYYCTLALAQNSEDQHENIEWDISWSEYIYFDLWWWPTKLEETIWPILTNKFSIRSKKCKNKFCENNQ